MKVYAVIFLIMLFCGAHAYVTLMLSTHVFERETIALMTHVPLLVFSSALFVSEYIGDNTHHVKQFQLLGKLIIFVFLLMYCLNYLGVVQGATKKLLLFYGINLAGLLMIFISTIKNGNFKD